MSYVLFFAYLALFSWLLTKSRFVIKAGLSSKIIVALFLLKVITGVIHFWLLMKITTSVDTRGFQREGLVEYHLLFSHPGEYFTNIFHSPYPGGYGHLLSSANSYWNDLSRNIIIKFLSVCDILSFGNFYVNVILYNYVVFFGAIGLYRVFNMIYINQSKLLIITCFLLPSLLFYPSSVHRDGLLLGTLGILVFNIYTGLKYQKFSGSKIFYIIAALVLVFLQRNYVFIALMPAIFAWVLAGLKKYPPLLTFTLVYLFATIIFFSAGTFFPTINLPESVAQKQVDFNHLTMPSTYIAVNQLEPTFKSFVYNIPQSLSHSLLRPFFTDIKLSPFLFPFAIEIFFYEIIFLVFLFFRLKTSYQTPFILFGIFFSLSIMLIIGYTVPVIGPITRYRSIYFPFILSPLICNIDWMKIKRHIQIKK